MVVGYDGSAFSCRIQRLQIQQTHEQDYDQRRGKTAGPATSGDTFHRGDGVGPEITAVTQKVVDAAVTKAYGGERRILWKEVLAGGKSFEQTGSWLPDETMQAFRDYKVGIKGPLTTPWAAVSVR